MGYKKEEEVYEKYKGRFKDKGYAENYHQSYNLNSISECINRKTLIGWLVAESEIRTIKNLLSSCKGNLVLDVPCGSGKLISELIWHNFSVIGVDSSKEMLLKVSNKNFNKRILAQADLRRLPLEDNSVDIIICNRFLHRIPPEYHLETLKELYRVSKEYAILYFPIRSVLTNYIIFLEKTLNIGDRGKIFYMSKKTIKEELDSSGWDFIKGTAVIPMFSTGYIIIAKKK